MRTKMTMLSRFSAGSLSQSVSPRRTTLENRELSIQIPDIPEEASEIVPTDV
jgi:hypothetical protein